MISPPGLGTTKGAIAGARFCRGRDFGCTSECCECAFCDGCANDSPQGITIPTSPMLEFGSGPPVWPVQLFRMAEPFLNRFSPKSESVFLW
jgi:hypothetical protein